MMTTILLTVAFFAACFLLMGIGLFIRGMVLKGSCGGAAAVLGERACGACAKKEKELCPSDDESGLLDISQISNPHRTERERRQEPGYQV